MRSFSISDACVGGVAYYVLGFGFAFAPINEALLTYAQSFYNQLRAATGPQFQLALAFTLFSETRGVYSSCTT
jgi:ammonia channel protein AmtB